MIEGREKGGFFEKLSAGASENSHNNNKKYYLIVSVFADKGWEIVTLAASFTAPWKINNANNRNIKHSVHIYEHEWRALQGEHSFSWMALLVCLLVKKPARFKIIKHTLGTKQKERLNAKV